MDKRKMIVAAVLLFIFGIGFGLGGGYWLAGSSAKQSQSDKTNATKVDAVSYATAEQQNEEISESEAAQASAQLEKQEIIQQYKASLGILFEAWKSSDLDTFRRKISQAYTGELLAKHLLQAEAYLSQGIGIYISDIMFDYIDIISYGEASATLEAIYRYKARDYDLDEKYPVGDEYQHFVHIRVNLVRIEGQWLITGESLI